MPLARRKKVLITKDGDALKGADPETQVYYIPQTGEIFEDYSAYISRMSFYRLKIFQCETSGRGNLTFFEALESEKAEARMLDARFPEQLKAAVLKSVQWQLVGRLDHLVEAVYERFKDRYFEGERVFVDFASSSVDEEHKESLGRGRYWARIVEVTPPQKARTPNGKRKASQMENGDAEDVRIPHDVYGDLKVPAAQVNALDDPKAYTYQAQLVDEGPNGTYTVVQPETHGDFRNGGTVMNVHCDVLSRDRLAFSKSILKRFIRECVEREAAVASPWIVKKDIALKYRISQQMPDDIRKGVDAVKRSESEKRKRNSEAKENPPPIKRPKRLKPPLTQEEKVAKAKDEEAARVKRERDEANRQALTGCKRPVARWPIEDLEVVLTEKEKASGKPIIRPLPHRTNEFAAPHVFESFLMAWNFITTYGHAFNVSPFSMDTLEAALHHSSEEPCLLIDALHAGIISSCRSVSAGMVKMGAAMNSLAEAYSSEMETDQEVDIETLISALSAFGSGWEKKAVNHETWCNALVSILKEHATVPGLPTLRPILSHLLFRPADPESKVTKDNEADLDEINGAWAAARPRERYHSLPFHLKVSVLSFLCDLSATSKAVHNALEQCETTLTEMRKEKIELKRQQKKVSDQILAMSPEKRKAAANKAANPKGNGKGKKNGDTEPDGTPPESILSEHESDEMVTAGAADLSMDATASEVASDDNLASTSATASEGPSGTGKGGSRTPRASLRFKAVDQARTAKKKEDPRPLSKQEEDELRQYEEEAAKVEQNLDTLELEFRQYLLLSRMRPLGKDRFHCKVWWFDGVGCMTLVGDNGEVLYGTGKIFVQGPSEDDLALIEAKANSDPSVGPRREAEEGNGLLGVGEWAWYETPDELESYLEWLNTKGIRENALEKTLLRWKPYIIGGMEARHKDLAAQARHLEGRRGRKSHESRENYMNYVNLYATK